MVSSADNLQMQVRAETKRCNAKVCFCVCQNLLSNILLSQDENQSTTRQHAASAAGQKCTAKGDADRLWRVRLNGIPLTMS